jgi:hypothetical protein
VVRFCEESFTMDGGLTQYRRALRALFSPILVAIVLLASAAAAQAATINVTTTSDAGTGTGDCLSADTSNCSLRQAINAEDATASGGDTIVLGSGTYSLTQGTELDITKSLTLEGHSAGSTTVDGSQNSGTNADGAVARILRIDSGTVSIQNLTFAHGLDGEDEACTDSCDASNADGGGALFNNGGAVALEYVGFTNDGGSGTPAGGAVSNGSGTLTMRNVFFSHDIAGAGGALFTRSGGVAGLGITFNGDGTTCCGGGAIYLLGGQVTLANATVVDSGGFDSSAAIANGGAALTLDNVTLSDNGADLQTDQLATTSVYNTILGSDGGVACVAPEQTDGVTQAQTGNAINGQESDNLDQDDSCGLSGSGDQSSVDPRLVPIFDNGGPTWTEALLAGSPALGDPGSSLCLPIDQRLVSRPDGSCDMGAFEAVLHGVPCTPTTGAAQDITDTSADLTATIDLRGEAGGFHFLYGTSTDQSTWTSSPEAPAGVVWAKKTVSETVSNLTPGTTYYYEVVADNASGSTSAKNIERFTTAATTVSGISPSSGPTAGGTAVTITGTYFTGATAVDFGSTPATSFTYDSPTQITAIAPPESAGTVDITVTSAGTSATAPADQYTYQAPPIATITAPFGGQTYALGEPAPTVFSCTDGLDGPGIQTCQDSNGATDGTGQLDTSTAGSYAYTLTATSQDGQTSTTTVSYTVAAAPAALITAPTDNQTYNLGQTVPTAFTCIEAAYGPGIRTCTDSNGATTGTGQLDTSTAGPHTYSVTAESVDGQTDVATIDYTVTAPQSGQSSQQSLSPTQPTVQTSQPSVNVTGAGFSGSVTPNGLPTTAYFQYGLDSHYTNTGSSGPTYTDSTPSQSIGSDFSAHAVGPITVQGLVPNAEYHVRLVAINGDGTVYGPDVSFTTPATPAPGTPTLGSTFNVSAVTGIVLIKINGVFVPLTETRQIPNGSVVNALHGSLGLLTANGQKNKTQHGSFGGAIFKLTQQRNGKNKGFVTLSIVENAFHGAPSYSLCRAHSSADASAASLSSKTLQLLRASAHGKFTTRGRYSSATVRGTIWTVADRCNGTLVHDVTDSVAVIDFVRHKTIILHAGQSYLARPIHPPR